MYDIWESWWSVLKEQKGSETTKLKLCFMILEWGLLTVWQNWINGRPASFKVAIYFRKQTVTARKGDKVGVGD